VIVDRSQLSGSLATVALAGNAVWLLLLMYLHLAERSLVPSRRYISEYVLTDSAWALHLVFGAMTLVGVALAVSLLLLSARTLPLALALLLFAGGIAAAGWWPTDPSTSTEPLSRAGSLHNEGARYAYRGLALAGIIGAPYALGLLGAPFSKLDPSWLLAGGALVAGYILTRNFADVPGPGIAQRAFIATALVWLSITATRILEATRTS
jgi:hypothetical protein